MMKYSLAMGIRVVCIVSILFVRDWWLLIPALGAIFLPYFAVVIANNSLFSRGDTLEQPGVIVRFDPSGAGDEPSGDESSETRGSESRSSDDEPKTDAS